VAGTKYRGQFEERMRVIIEELTENPDIIIFIDEIHTLVGAGNASGSMDASNIFKPALARGEIQCIGATTLDEYRTNFEKDGALERRFQKVVVDSPSKEETLLILKNSKDRYEDFHKVSYSDEILEMCVNLADRYITDREFPDKAFDILDEVGARSQVEVKVPEAIEVLKQ
jgi:ATP-dependent Clp protease ATP-binding subunit ClpC